MTQKHRHILALGIGLLVSLITGIAGAQSARPTASGDGGPIGVTADQLTVGDGGTKVEASGNVEIKRDFTTLKADKVRVDRESQDVEASGNVSVEDPEWRIKSADSVELNLGKETGEIRNGDIFIEQGHISIMGRRFQKFSGQAYHVEDVSFTTCLCQSGPPSWKITAEELDLAPDGLATIRNGYFSILDVPVFYLPYGFFPVRTERQTGLLVPKVGSSTKEGFRFQQPFFWAVSKSTDATLAFDIQTRARVGVIGELRHLFSRDSDFFLNTSFFNETFRTQTNEAVVDRTIADQRIPQNRWSIIATHRYLTSAEWLTYSDIAAYRDDLFTRELAERLDIPQRREFDVRTSRFAESRFGLFRDWRDTFVKGEWNFYQDFIQPDATTLQRTPHLAFWGRRFLDELPLEFRWRVAAVNYMRREGGDGLRFDLRPEVVLPFNLASYLFGSLSVAPRETLYHLYSPVESSNRNISRELLEIRGQISTKLSRIFAFSGFGMKAINHVVEPEIRYLFVPSSDQSAIPIMDGVDRINRRNVLTLAVANRFWGKLASPILSTGEDSEAELLNPIGFGGVRELAHLRFALSYDVDKERKGGDSLTDLDVNLRLQPLSYLSVTVDGGLDPGPWNITQARSGLTVSDPRPMLRRSLDADFNRPSSFSLNYYFLRRGPNAFLAENANVDCIADPTDLECTRIDFRKNVIGNLTGNLFYHVADNLLVALNGTYSVRDSRFLGIRAAAKVLSSCECWSVTLGIKRNINPSKTSFSFDFNLLGLGSPRSTLQ